MTTGQWFPLPLYEYQCETIKERKDLNNDLPLSEFTHREGWSADTHQLTPHPFESNVIENSHVFQSFLKTHVHKYLQEIGIKHIDEYYINNSWYTSTTNGQYAHLHSHGGSDISGVYYISTNQRDGNIYFHSPHYVSENNYIIAHLDMARQVTPSKGKLLLWPSFLMHGTRINETNHNRVSLSFNITFRR